MDPKLSENLTFIRLRAKIVNNASSKTLITFPRIFFPFPHEISSIRMRSRPIGEWNTVGTPETCMICWKPLDLQGKDARTFMECRHCHRKAHQEHMLRWLSRKNHCPYCQNKW